MKLVESSSINDSTNERPFTIIILVCSRHFYTSNAFDQVKKEKKKKRKEQESGNVFFFLLLSLVLFVRLQGFLIKFYDFLRSRFSASILHGVSV